MIVAIVVTYNRLSLLKECLMGIQSQTIKLDKIIIVNNGSTDGTNDWLKDQTAFHIINQENCGGAGGFSTGIKYAYEQGAKWIWLMDDDVIPEINCLEELFKYSTISKCLQASRISSDGVDYQWGEYLDLCNYKKHKITNLEINNKEFYFVNVGCFEGMLIHSDIVSKIGYPDSRFFISGDDTIYGYLANRYTNVCCIKSARMIRAKKSTENFVSPMYFYYTYRNFHLYEEYYFRLTNKQFSLQVRMNFFFTSMLVIIKLFSKNYDFSQKVKIAKAIILGIIHCQKKKVNNTFL
jgi:GT2 family glycosyltransferase